MTKAYELYHGAFLRSLFVESGMPLTITANDTFGLVNTFLINEQIAIFLKHSSKRLAPWTFNFDNNHIRELLELSRKCRYVFICLVCGTDGSACISTKDFIQIVCATAGEQVPVRVDRNRGSMYSVIGNNSKLDRKIARGNGIILEALNQLA